MPPLVLFSGEPEFMLKQLDHEHNEHMNVTLLVFWVIFVLRVITPHSFISFQRTLHVNTQHTNGTGERLQHYFFMSKMANLFFYNKNKTNKKYDKLTSLGFHYQFKKSMCRRDKSTSSVLFPINLSFVRVEANIY